MIFHEIYGSYYRALAEILRESQEKTRDKTISITEIKEICDRHAFEYSFIAIEKKLLNGDNPDWPFLKDREFHFKHIPHRPTSLLEKRWLATILKDPRVQLFLPEDGKKMPELSLDPLWEKEDIFYFDQHNDRDPFEAPEYIQNFRAMLSAIREKKKVSVNYISNKEKHISCTGSIIHVEYSQKDDKFRFLLLLDSSEEYPKKITILNAAQIQTVKLLDQEAEGKSFEIPKKQVEVEIRDERNALNRAMLQFSDLEKKTEAKDENTYHMTISYYPTDEAEIIIRLLAFGHLVKVLSPEGIVKKVKERLMKQKKLRALAMKRGAMEK